MKYIHNRINYRLITELLNSDEINVEFGETLIGGLLHRLLGYGRSKWIEGEINTKIDQLDRLLASIVTDLISKNKKNKEIIVNLKINMFLNYLEKSIKEAEKGDFKEAQKALPEGNNYLPAVIEKRIGKELELYKKHIEKQPNDKKEITLVGKNINYKEEIYKIFDTEEKDNKIILKKVVNNKGEEIEDIGYYDIDKNKFFDKNGEEIFLLDGDKKENKQLNAPKKILSLPKIEEINEDNIEEIYNKAVQVRDNVIKHCDKCKFDEKDKKEVFKLRTIIDNILSRFESLKNNLKIIKNKEKEISDKFKQMIENDKKELKIQDLNDVAKKIYDICDRCKISESIILEKDINQEANDIADNVIEIIKGKLKEFEKEFEKEKVTEEDIKRIDEEIKNAENKKGDIDGDKAKKLIDILTSAKDILMHVKPYEQIRKNQQRYFDKLESERAINRKGYKTWVAGVNKLVNYYKDLLPVKVITLITDSLDKKNISDDYVTLNKEFLGIDARNKLKGSAIDDNFLPDENNTSDDKLIFKQQNNFNYNDSLVFILVLENINDGKKITVTGILISDLDNVTSVNFKYTSGANVSNWVKSYIGNKKQISTKDPKIKFVEALPKKVGYGVINKKNLRINEEFELLSYDFTSLLGKNPKVIQNDKNEFIINEKQVQNTEVKKSKYKILDIRVLTGSNDGKPAIVRLTNSIDTASKGVDKFFSKSLYVSLNKFLNSEEEERIQKLFDKLKAQNPKYITYNSIKEKNKEYTNDVVKFKDNGKVIIKGKDGKEYEIDKSQINY
jgi:hypothetical protein